MTVRRLLSVESSSVYSVTVCRLRDNMCGGEAYSAEEAEAILTEVRSIEQLLRAGQREKRQLHHSLRRLGEDIR